jgi:hypothetical protein
MLTVLNFGATASDHDLSAKRDDGVRVKLHSSPTALRAKRLSKIFVQTFWRGIAPRQSVRKYDLIAAFLLHLLSIKAVN